MFRVGGMEAEGDINWGLTNGGMYWKLFASPSSEIVCASRSTKAISIILVKPAAINV
jgi:hypothetical protein